MTDDPTTLTFLAEESRNIDTVTYRGHAPLWQLTRVSQADVFDQVTNPDGLQRDLNKRHALDAYEYAARPADKERPRAYPEVLLNVRDRKVVAIEAQECKVGDDSMQLAHLTFDLAKIDAAKTVKVSRVDGNHRLFFGAGDGKERPPLEVLVPFSITVGLSREQEASLFSDINAEQKGLNTSHLAVLRARLTPDEQALATNPARVFALRLANDEASPWHELVHMGGSKAGSKEAGIRRPVTFIALEQGVRRILRKSQYISDLTTFDAQYGLVRTYWQAVRAVWPEAWENPGEWIILKNLGVATLSTLGATIIDRCMAAGEVEPEHMIGFLLKAREAVDWRAASPDVAGMSGNQAALALAGRMAEALPKRPPRAPSPVLAGEDNR